MNYTVLDFETTGLDPEHDEVIEFALVRVRDGRVDEHLESLCRPLGEIPYASYQVHKISKRETLRFPTFAERLQEVYDYIGQDTVVCHNVPFDMGFLNAYARRAGIVRELPTLDTLTLARQHLSHIPSRSLKNIAAYLRVPRFEAHRALGDALTTAHVLLALLDYDNYDRLAHRR